MKNKEFEPKKIQFAFSKEALQKIDELAKESGSFTKSEVIRNALKIYSWVIDKQKEGCSIHAVSKNGDPLIELADQRFPSDK